MSIVVHAFDVAHELQIEPIERMLDPAMLRRSGDAIAALLNGRLQRRIARSRRRSR